MSKPLIGAAYLAFLVANLIHNSFSLDPAIVPATILVVLYWWRSWRIAFWAAALLIALPSFYFFKASGLTNPASARYFFNHLALIVAGSFAVVSVLVTVVARRQTVEQL